MNNKDTLFDKPISEPADFVFDERVVNVFPDMIKRSVPGYELLISMIGVLARYYAQPRSCLYDLGCSLGAVSLVMSRTVCADRVRIISIDSSEDMIRRFEKIDRDDTCMVPIQTICGDVRQLAVDDASVVVLNFTLQFINPPDRQPLLDKIAKGTRSGGILILSEKICFENTSEQVLQTAWHDDFKRAQGYSELEIAGKREALENVMKTETVKTHTDRMLAAGFSEVYQWFQCLGFSSFIAIR